MLFVLIMFSTPIFFASCSQKIVDDTNWQLVASGFSFPEGPAWDGESVLYVSNCYSNWIAKIEDGKVDTFLTASENTFEKTNGMIVSRSGDIFACDFGRGAILKITQDGVVNVVVAGFNGEKLNRPNDINFDRNGNLYFTDPKSYGADQPDGRVFFHVLQTGRTELVAENMDFPNGLALSPLANKLYVCESGKHRVVRFDVVENGQLENREIFAELPGGDPDGIDFDVNGNLYVAHFGSGTVFIISPKGEILNEIKTPGKKPSNLDFGGKDRKTLFLTEDETNAVYKLRMNVAGYKAY